MRPFAGVTAYTGPLVTHMSRTCWARAGATPSASAQASAAPAHTTSRRWRTALRRIGAGAGQGRMGTSGFSIRGSHRPREAARGAPRFGALYVRRARPEQVAGGAEPLAFRPVCFAGRFDEPDSARLAPVDSRRQDFPSRPLGP